MSEIKGCPDFREPQIGDLVYFYWFHAFGAERLPEIVPNTPIWRATGAGEMRCRPARVASVALNKMDLILEVEFTSDDMYGSAQGVVGRMPRDQYAAVHIEELENALAARQGRQPPELGRVIAGRWPAPWTWAWDPMPPLERHGADKR